MSSADGSRLFINNTLAINNSGLHGNIEIGSGVMALKSGPLAMQVDYFNNAVGGSQLQLSYQGPDTLNIKVIANATPFWTLLSNGTGVWNAQARTRSWPA